MNRPRLAVAARLLVAGTLLAIVNVAAPSVSAAQPAHATHTHADRQIVLPGAASAEGLALGFGSTFYAGELFTGNIYRGDLLKGTAKLFVRAPAGRAALGMTLDRRHGLLFVAGGFTGAAYVYNARTGAPVAECQLASPPPTTFVNDVALTPNGAWFTDSVQARLFFIPVSHKGKLGAVRTVPLTGPAADTSGAFNNNGIQATPDGKILIVAHSQQGALNTVNPRTGTSAAITGVSVPSVDGIHLYGNRLFAVENFPNTIAEVRLNPGRTSGSVVKLVTSPLFEVPTAVARFGDRLVTVNSKFDTGFPPTATQFEVVIVNR